MYLSNGVKKLPCFVYKCAASSEFCWQEQYLIQYQKKEYLFLLFLTISVLLFSEALPRI